MACFVQAIGFQLSARPIPTCRTRLTATNPHTPWHTTSPVRAYLCHSWHPIRTDRSGHMRPALPKDGWPCRCAERDRARHAARQCQASVPDGQVTDAPSALPAVPATQAPADHSAESAPVATASVANQATAQPSADHTAPVATAAVAAQTTAQHLATPAVSRTQAHTSQAVSAAVAPSPAVRLNPASCWYRMFTEVQAVGLNLALGWGSRTQCRQSPYPEGEGWGSIAQHPPVGPEPAAATVTAGGDQNTPAGKHSPPADAAPANPPPQSTPA